MMTEFLTLIFAFPTIVFTGLLGVMVFYWLFVIFGAVDVDALGGAEGAAEGAIEGAAEGAIEGAAEAAVEGAIEGAAEGAVEGAAEAAVEGAAEAAVEAAVEGAAEGAVEGAAEGTEGVLESAHAGLSFFGLLHMLGLRKAPFTVVMSIMVLAGWLACCFGMKYLGPILGSILPEFVAGGLIFAMAWALAIPVASSVSIPMAPLFATHEADQHADLVGRTCIVDTGTVDEKFGMATVEEGGSWAKIHVRAAVPNHIERGEEVLIVAYHREQEIFRVESMGIARADPERVANRTKAPQGATTNIRESR